MSKDIKVKHPMLTAIATAGEIFVLSVLVGSLIEGGEMAILGIVVVSVVLGIVPMLLACLLAKIQAKEFRDRIKWTGVIVLCGVLPCWGVIACFDCNPPDDAELVLPQSDEPYVSDGNGWAMLADVMSRVTALTNCKTNSYPHGIEFASAKDKLLRYVGYNSYAIKDASDNMLDFANAANRGAYVDACIKSNAWLLAGIDSAIAASKYAPPPVRMMIGRYQSLSCGKLPDLNRSFLLARVKREIEKGDFNAAIEYYRRSLRLATLLQTHCGTYSEHCDGTQIISDDMFFLEHIVDNDLVPTDKLRTFNELLQDLPGFSQKIVIHALKLEYSILKEREMSQKAHVYTLPKDGSFFSKAQYSLLNRYRYHPNRYLRALSKTFRSAIREDWAQSGCVKKNHWDFNLNIDSLTPIGCGRDMALLLSDTASCMISCKSLTCHLAEKTVERIRRRIAGRISPPRT